MAPPHDGERDAPRPPTPTDLTLSRRGVLRGAAGAAGAAGLTVFASEHGAIAVRLDPATPRFLTPAELRLLAAVVDRAVPGQPEDLAAGAVQAGCHEAIDALLAAFSTDPPRIFAGGPYSDRGGSPVNHFQDFLPLDAYEERAWRLRIEGDPDRGVLGHQQVYRRGLTALAKSSPLFASLPGVLRDVALRTTGNADIKAMRDLAITHAVEFFFAAPEYGGNRGLAGWKAVGFEGDTQPRGFTRDEVDSPAYAPLPLLTASLDEFLGALVGSLLGAVTGTVSGLLSTVSGGRAGRPAEAAAPALALSTTEGLHGLSAAGTDHASVQEALGTLLGPLQRSDTPESRRLQQLHARAAEIAAEAKAGGAQ